jgi:hypothetical protein
MLVSPATQEAEMGWIVVEKVTAGQKVGETDLNK